MARPWQPRTLACLAVACCLTAAVVAGPASAGEGTPTPAATVDVPVDASAGTKAAVRDAEQRLTQLQTQVAQTALDYKSAQARLSLARQTVAAAERQAFAAEQAVAQARVQVGQYAANAYMGGPMMAPAAILNSDDATELMHVTGMLEIVGNSQTGALHRLQQGRTDAIAATDRARTGRQAAGVAKAEAIAYAAQAKQQMAETVRLLESLQVRADKEAAQAKVERAIRLAAARAAALSATGGIADLPPEATAPGPVAALPEEAGPDPGDGEPGSDHLRPRAERALLLVEDVFGITDIGGWRQSDSVSSDHPQGRAIDVMMGTLGALPDAGRVTLGWQLARWAQANAAGLGVTYVIWQGRIWSVARSAEGWRDYTVNFPYGSNVTPTTLHMDHVHISFG